MTSKVGFFCKSYSKDFKHLNLMLETYGDHNPENIPLVLSLPKNDINEFRMNFGIKLQNVSVVADESYCDDDLSKYNGWLGQQICKLMSGHIMDAEHYAVLDSDCYFIRDVSASELCPANGKDFVACGSLIRTVLKPSNLDLIRYINGDLALDRSHFPAPPKAPVNRLRDYIKYQNLNQDSVDVINISDIPFKIFGGSKWYYFQPGQIFSSNLLKKLIDCFASFGLRPETRSEYVLGSIIGMASMQQPMSMPGLISKFHLFCTSKKRQTLNLRAESDSHMKKCGADLCLFRWRLGTCQICYFSTG